METEQRHYNMKDEELPVVCEFVATSLKRDLVEFKHYSPHFDDAYLLSFENKIAESNNIIIPSTEILERKLLTERLYTTLDDLIDPLNRLEGYAKIAKIKVSASDFGFVALRKGIRGRDVEGAIHALRIVNTTIVKYKEQLLKEGLTEDLCKLFTYSIDILSIDNKKQYEMLSNRKAIVHANLQLFNELNEVLTEICRVGRILYKFKNPSKLDDYTLTKLKKNVRIVLKPKNEKPAEPDVTPPVDDDIV